MKNTNSGFLINRPFVLPSEESKTRTKRTPSVSLTSDEINARYRGIDGEAWPNKDLLKNAGLLIPEDRGLVRYDQKKLIMGVYNELFKQSGCRLIFLSYGSSSNIDPDLVFFGYDYGNFISEYNYFSVIYHEIIYGRYAALRKYATRLNEHLLFPDLDSMINIQSDRNVLVSQGADLEHELIEEPYGPIKICGLRDCL